MKRAGLAGTFFALAVSFVAAAHPADTLTPKSVEDGYGTSRYGISAENSFGDFQFYAPYPAPASLTNAERYVLWGTIDSHEGDYGKGPWWKDVITIALVNYDRTGAIPVTISEAEVRTASWQPNAVGMGILQWYKSPISGRFPRLDAKEFSAGDLFVKQLNEAEIQEACSFHSALDEAYNKGQLYFPGTDSGDVVKVKMSSPVLYVRIYGEQEVIYSELYWTCTER